LACILEGSDAFFAGLWAPELVGMKELFSLALPAFLQGLRIWESLDEGPRTRTTPVIECFQGSRIIIMESLLELIDEPGAFFDQCHLIPAEDAQFKDDGILIGESPPSVAVKAQGVGECSSIMLVGLVAAGTFSLPVALGVHWVHRVDWQATFQQLLNGSFVLQVKSIRTPQTTNGRWSVPWSGN